MEVFGKSDIGLVRNTNQDSFLTGKLSDDVVWVIVCDGMGGASGGNVASGETVKIIKERIDELADPKKMSNEDISSFMVGALKQANAHVYEMAENDQYLNGMGTTCEFVFVINGRVHVAHVGDSRTYLVRGGKLIQITEDHSFVQEMVRQGHLTKEEAENHPNKNIITRAIGVMDEVDVDYIETDFEQGDRILTCTDGLSNMVSAKDILEIASSRNGVLVVEKLVGKALLNGGYDNITLTAIY